MPSPARRLQIVALVIASLIGVVAAIGLHHARNRTTQAPATIPSSSSSTAPSVARVEQLRGYILDANGNPVGSAHVRVLEEARVISETATDPAGRFSFDRLPSGPARVEADHDPEGAVRSAEISVSAVTTDLTLVLVSASIRGIVVDADDGHPIPGAALSAEGLAFAAPATLSDAVGAFHFAVVPFEATAIVGVANGYRTARVTLGPRENLPEPVLRIELRSAPPIDGDVVDQEGTPIHAQVIACEGQPFEARVESGDDGAFTLPPSSVGCDAFAMHDELAPSDAVKVIVGRHTTLRLGAPGAIAGVVRDERGASIESATVGVESFIPAASGPSSAPAPRGRASAFKNGVFRLEKLVPGTYVLTAATTGRPPARSSPIVVRRGVVTDGVKIMIATGGVIEGRVLDDQQVPLADVELRFDMLSMVASSDAVATTDASGHYHLEGAPSGLFTMSIRKEGYRLKLVSGLSVSSGQTTTKDITLTKGSGLELSGIGANLAPAGNGIALAGILPGDPADRAGLHPGDRIERIDGEEIAGLSLVDAIQRLRGEPGTVVGITVLRGGEILDVTITRGVLVR